MCCLYSIPIIGIIDSTAKYVSKQPNLNTIGVIATSGTIRSNGWQSALLKYNPNLNIINKSCPLLAPMAEEGWTNNQIANLTVNEYMKELYNVDALILGCTHYPLFTNIFKKYLKPDSQVINTGTIIAQDLCTILGSNLLNTPTHIGSLNIYLTDTECNFVFVADKLLNNSNLVIHNVL